MADFQEWLLGRGGVEVTNSYTAKKPLEITCWRAKFLGEIRIGRWNNGAFDRVAGVPTTGEVITKAELRKAEALRKRLSDALFATPHSQEGK